MGEARAAARRTPSPKGFKGRCVGGVVRCWFYFPPKHYSSFRAERPEGEARNHFCLNYFSIYVSKLFTRRLLTLRLLISSFLSVLSRYLLRSLSLVSSLGLLTLGLISSLTLGLALVLTLVSRLLTLGLLISVFNSRSFNSALLSV